MYDHKSHVDKSKPYIFCFFPNIYDLGIHNKSWNFSVMKSYTIFEGVSEKVLSTNKADATNSHSIFNV